MLQHYSSCWTFIKIVIKTSRCNCFLERTNHECIIDRFRRVVHTLSVTSTPFVESRAKLLNAYNEPGSHSSYSLFKYIALCNANETIPSARSSVCSFNTIIMHLHYSLRRRNTRYKKPSTCRPTLFRCKFSSMFPVFHLA